jgi:hypothetical protein
MAPEFLQLDTTDQSRINYRMTARNFSRQPTLILVMGISERPCLMGWRFQFSPIQRSPRFQNE